MKEKKKYKIELHQYSKSAIEIMLCNIANELARIANALEVKVKK